MKITVFFRSQEKNNAIVSATKMELENLQNRGEMTFLDVDFVNLDKRNYKKYFATLNEQENLPSIVYIWWDEENITEYINETYPNIKVYHFDTKIIKKEETFYGIKRKHSFLDVILENFKLTLEKQKYILVNPKKKITEVLNLDDISLSEKLKYSSFVVVNTIDEAMDLFRKSYEKEIEDLISDINYYTSVVKSKKVHLKKAIKDLAKLDEQKEKYEKLLK